MKLIGLMLARNEEWIIGASADAALKWCDELVVLDHGSTDKTPQILKRLRARHSRRLHILRTDESGWDEMHHRQATLHAGRELHGTHFAICDADEIITANWLGHIRPRVQMLRCGEVLDLPMKPLWRSLDEQRSDSCVWTDAVVTVAFADRPGNPEFGWRPKEDGYQHHSRAPASSHRCWWDNSDIEGGMMHLEFADWPRLQAKHAWYKMREKVLFPDREPVQALNSKYNQAPCEGPNLETSPVPADWWAGHCKKAIRLGTTPWHVAECRAMLKAHGREFFEGLDLFGVV